MEAPTSSALRAQSRLRAGGSGLPLVVSEVLTAHRPFAPHPTPRACRGPYWKEDSMSIVQIPLRLASGAFILNSGLNKRNISEEQA